MMLALAILSTLLTQSPGQIAKGANLPPLKVHVIKEDSSEEKDLTKDRPERKTVYLFLPGDRFDRPAARFLRSLDQDLVKQPGALLSLKIPIPKAGPSIPMTSPHL